MNGLWLIIYEDENGKNWRKAHNTEDIDKFIKDNELDNEPCYYEVIDLKQTELHDEIKTLRTKLTEINNILKG